MNHETSADLHPPAYQYLAPASFSPKNRVARKFVRELDIMKALADRMGAMVRILAALLIVTTVVGNTAWALDVHFDDWNNHVAAEFGASDDGGGPVHDGPACPDHCSHGAAHLLGLHMDNLTIYASFPGRSEFTRSDRLTTRFPILPSEPPRA